jgi:hypothetical protein
VPDAQARHLPEPSQLPSFPQLLMEAAGHSEALRDVPALSGAHTPFAFPVLSNEHP